MSRKKKVLIGVGIVVVLSAVAFANFKFKKKPGVTVNTEYEWQYRMPAARPAVLNEAEHSASRWLPIDEAIETVWSWTNRQALEELKATL